jgi:hypothetical protein
LPPLQRQWQQQESPPVQQAPVLPNGSGQGAAGQAVPGQANPGQMGPDQLPGQLAPGQAAPGPFLQGQGQAPPATPPATVERPNIWMPAAAAKLQALDKVNAQTSELTIKVGQSATFGSLTITVKSCMIRPSDQPADAAAYLDVTDSHPDSPNFDGWLLEDEPSVSMMQHPIYDLRVTGCA